MSKPKPLVYEFDNFRLDTAERQLFRDGRMVTLSSKAFDLLLVLVENSGRLVEKEELYQRVWADQVVEESNLTVQMSAIRKALGETRTRQNYINTVTGHGYRFIGSVNRVDDDDEVVIETHTRSRIVIEREEADAGAGYSVQPAFSAVEVRDDVNRLVPEPELEIPESSSVSARQALSDVERNNVSTQRRRVLMFAAGILVVILGAGYAWFYQSRSRGAAASPVLTLRRFTAHGGIPYRVAISPDGKSLVYTQRINKKDSLWLGQIETNTSVPLNQQLDLTFDNLVFAPDGGSIYFNIDGPGYKQAMLGRMSVLGGAITDLFPRVAGPVTFAPGGKQMAFLQRDVERGLTSIIIADTPDGQAQTTLLSLSSPDKFASGSLSWSPDAKSIAFGSTNANGHEDVMAVNVIDGSVRKLANRDWGNVRELAWLPDNSGVLVRASENIGERMRQIWLVSYPSGDARRITNDLNVFLGQGPSVSSDGKVALLQGHYNSEIWIAPHGDVSKAVKILQGVPPRYEGIDGLAWIPGGRLLYTAYVGDSEVIWSINGDGSDLKQLTPGKANASDLYPCPTSDGRYLVFQSNRSGSVEIWRANGDGSNLKQLTSGGNNAVPSLSPDGHWIVYITTKDEKRTLMRVSIEGGESTQLTNAPVSFAQVSPDGASIACLGLSPKRLFVMPFSGGEPIRVFPLAESSLRGVPRLCWTPDGRAILYRDGVQGLLRQSLDESTARTVKGYEELPIRNFAWSSDGKSLAYVSAPASQEIILIENFK